MKRQRRPSQRLAGYRFRFATALVSSVVFIGGCYTGPKTDHFEGILDDLALPAQWHQVKTERRGPGEASGCDPVFNMSCPTVRRWFLAPDDPTVALRQAEEALAAAGYDVWDIALPNCDGYTGTAVCSVFSDGGDAWVVASIYVSAAAAGLDGPAGEQVVVRVSASRYSGE